MISLFKLGIAFVSCFGFMILGETHAQNIQSVIFIVQEHDEPPTVQGRPTDTIQFKAHSDGALYADRGGLKIEARRLATFDWWQKTAQQKIILKDWGLDQHVMQAKADREDIHFPVPDEWVIQSDSFRICEGFKMAQVVSAGGETVQVIVIDNAGHRTVLAFPVTNPRVSPFPIQAYLLGYILLHDLFPDTVAGHAFFSRGMLEEVLIEYIKVIPCEGFYYQEYLNRNPQLTPQERRTRKGWNFKDYLQQRRAPDRK